MKARLQLGCLVVVASGCATGLSPEVIDANLDAAMQRARRLHRDGDSIEAYQFLTKVQQIDPDRPDARELLAVVRSDSPELEDLFHKPLLGSNRAVRIPTERPLWARILLYLPDRVLDLLDVLSFDVHVGPGVLVNVHLTRAVQLGAGARAVAGIGWHDHRSLGFLAQSEAEVVIPAVGTSAWAGAMAGTSGIYAGSDGIFDLHRPTIPLYQDFRDYWAVGFSTTAVTAGFDFDLHPLEIADFLAGLLTIDFLRDDFAATRGVGITIGDQMLLWRLSDVIRSPAAVAAYREHPREP